MNSKLWTLACLLLPFFAQATGRAQGSKQNASDEFIRLAERWDDPQWKPILASCIRGEVESVRQLVATSEAKYSSFERRSQLDSAKAVDAILAKSAPIVARARCLAKNATLTSFFVAKDGFDKKLEKIDPMPKGIELHRLTMAFYADWLPNRWVQVRSHMLVSGPDTFIRTGPWAMNEATLRMLTQGKSTDNDIQKALAEAGGRMVLDQMILSPWSTLYNTNYSSWDKVYAQYITLAIEGREEFAERMKAKEEGPEIIAGVTRVMKAIFCQYTKTPLPKAQDTPGFTYFDVCPTPSP